MLPTVPAFADEKGDRTKDEESIKQVTKAWQEAWNKHDAAGLAALVIEDVDFVRNNTGWLKGRKQFQDFHAEIHKRYFKDSEWTTKETKVRFLRPDVAIVQVVWAIKGDTIPDRKPDQPRDGIFTWVLEKRDGKWLVVTSHNSEAPPPGSPRPLDEDQKAKPDQALAPRLLTRKLRA